MDKSEHHVRFPGGALPGPNDGHSWAWVGNGANPMRIAVNRGFGWITAKSANVQLRVFESQIRTRGAGRRSILIFLLEYAGLCLGSSALSASHIQGSPAWAAA